MSIWTKLFWKDTFERVIATVAQVLVALLSVDGLDLATIDVGATFTALGIAAALAFLKAILAASKSGPTVSPASLVSDDV